MQYLLHLLRISFVFMNTSPVSSFNWHCFSFGLFMSFHIATDIWPGLFSVWELLKDAFCMCKFLSFLIDFWILWESWEISALWDTAFLISYSWHCSISDHVFSGDSSSSDHILSLGMSFFPHSINTLHIAFHISSIFVCVRLSVIAENPFSTSITGILCMSNLIWQDTFYTVFDFSHIFTYSSWWSDPQSDPGSVFTAWIHVFHLVGIRM